MLRKTRNLFAACALTVPLGVGVAAAHPVHAQTPPVVAPSPTLLQNAAGVSFLERSVTTPTGTYRYQVFVPAHRNARKSSPVILFLHGSGERGDDNQAQTKNGVRLMIAQDTDKFPCIVVCPQCSANSFWTQPEMEEQALAALDQSLKEFNGDPKRVYLTGLSMGGYGTWDLAQKYPDRWAAIAPCCGGLRLPRPPRPSIDTTTNQPILPPQPVDPYRDVALKITHLPTWVFHGSVDPAVPVAESRQMVALLFSLKADLTYTEYPGVGHNSWDYAYKEPGLLPWFLAHKR